LGGVTVTLVLTILPLAGVLRSSLASVIKNYDAPADGESAHDSLELHPSLSSLSSSTLVVSDSLEPSSYHQSVSQSSEALTISLQNQTI